MMCIAAPVEFSYAPPWWLLIEKPEYWPKGLEDWTKVFDYCLKTFLKVMEEYEDSMIQKGRLKEDQRLSGSMYQSWESGDFWVIYAALHSFAFDVIYWQKIDARFFGLPEDPETAWKERLDLLDEKDKRDMEQLVARKMEMKTRILAWDRDEYTVASSEQLKRQRDEADEAHTSHKDGNNEVENKGNETGISGFSETHNMNVT